MSHEWHDEWTADSGVIRVRRLRNGASGVELSFYTRRFFGNIVCTRTNRRFVTVGRLRGRRRVLGRLNVSVFQSAFKPRKGCASVLAGRRRRRRCSVLCRKRIFIEINIFTRFWTWMIWPKTSDTCTANVICVLHCCRERRRSSCRRILMRIFVTRMAL